MLTPETDKAFHYTKAALFKPLISWIRTRGSDSQFQ